MPEFSLIAEDNCVPLDVLAFIAAAVDQQMRLSVAKAYDTLEPWTVSALSSLDKLEDAPGVRKILTFKKQLGVKGALGFHTSRLGIEYAEALVPAVKGDVIDGTVASHEVLETFADPLVDQSWPMPNGAKVDFEICLAGETIVPLADGSRQTIRELAARGFGPLDVLSSGAGGEIVVSRARGARLTARDADTVRVTLADGQRFRCTRDHKILMANGDYRKAGLLAPGDRLSKVGPGNSTPDAADHALCYAVASGQDAAVFGARQNRQDVIGGQFGASMKLSSSIPVALHAALVGGVQHVGLMRTGEKMSRVRANRVVAGVTNLLASRDRPMMRLVGQAMDEMGSVFEPDLPVSSTVLCSRPIPTSLSDHHASPEHIQRRGCRPDVFVDKASVHSTVSGNSSVMSGTHAFRAERPGASEYGARSGHPKVVHSVEDGGKADVYDLSVPGNHNFAIGAGVFVHNCDPVESDSYPIQVRLGQEVRVVRVSNFVTPRWFGLPDTGGFDFMGRLTAPFTMTAGGYYRIVDIDGSDSYIYADKTAQDRVAAKLANATSRVTRRNAR